MMVLMCERAWIKTPFGAFFPDIERERLLSRPSPQTETAADFEAFELPFGCNQRASAGKVRADEEFPSTLKTDPNTSKH